MQLVEPLLSTQNILKNKKAILYNNTYNNVHLKRKHYVHRYEYELNEIKKLEDKLKNLKASFIKKYPSEMIEEIKSKH